jgi:hypothetical protein
MRERIAALAVAMAACWLITGCGSGVPRLERNAPPLRIVICAPELTARAPERAETLAREERAAALMTAHPRDGRDGMTWRWDSAPAMARTGIPAALSLAPDPVASFDAGPAHFCFLDNTAPVTDGGPAALALIEDLSRSRKALKFLFLARPIAAGGIDADLDYLGRLIERENVLLVIAPGAGGYLRSRPVGVSTESAVRYIALPTDARRLDPPRPWLARIIAGGDHVLLDVSAQGVLWRLLDRNGKALDILDIPAHNRAGTAGGMMTYGEVFAAVSALNAAAPPSGDAPK